jgi:uncharacterized cupin superfamily protein
MTRPLTIPALDPATVTPKIGSVPPKVPVAYRSIIQDRRKWQMSELLGLQDFGVNIVELPSGAKSSLGHWHSHEDEFIFVLDGELALITDEGKQTIGAGMAAGFPKGRRNGHHLINEAHSSARYLEIGSRHPEDVATYSDVDLKFSAGGYWTKAGKPVPSD